MQCDYVIGRVTVLSEELEVQCNEEYEWVVEGDHPTVQTSHGKPARTSRGYCDEHKNRGLALAKSKGYDATLRRKGR